MINLNSKFRSWKDRKQFISGVLSKMLGHHQMPARWNFPQDNDFIVEIMVKKSNSETLTISSTNSNLLNEPTWVGHAIKNYLNGKYQDMSVGVYTGKDAK